MGSPPPPRVLVLSRRRGYGLRVRFRWGLVLGLGLAVFASSVAAATTGATLARIGGAPSLDYPRLPPGSGNRAQSNPFVIGRGSAFNGAVEIVAMDSREGLCVWADHPGLGETSGICTDSNLVGRGRAIAVNLWSRSLTRGYTQLAGPLSAEVAKVRVFRGGSRVAAIVAHVGDRLRRRLHQPGPFGYFSVTVPGCVPPTAFRVVALDGRGRTLGSDRGSAGAGACG
jgi:hypothetical protein